MIRQVWVFMEEADERALLERVTSQGAVRLLRGRFFRGTEDDVRSRPEQLETAQLTRREFRTHLIHSEFSKSLVVHPHESGPHAGWASLDEARSEIITIIRPEREERGLAPTRFQAATHAWFGGTRLRKSPEFTRWVAAFTKELEKTLPVTSLDWMRIAPAALQSAEAGGRLHYLYKDVFPYPTGERPPRSHGHREERS